MQRPSSPFLLFAALVGLGVGVSSANACGYAASFDDYGGGASGDGVLFVSSATGNNTSADVAPDSPMPPAALSYKYLCGEGTCVPGKDLSCTPTPTQTVSATSAGTGSGSGTGGGAGGYGGAGAGGGGSVETTGAGGADAYTCRVAIDRGMPSSVCLPVGAGQLSDPCQSSDQCAEGLGCVEVDGMSTVGVCLPYCCGALEDCGPMTFCNPRRSVDTPTRRVPVCEPAVECSLLTPGACTDGRVCTVVRVDGTTSCVDRGDGKACDPCPCDDGYVCNPSINQCRKLCHTDGATNDCGNGTCQGGSGNYPKGIGVCVGGEATCD